MVVFIDTSAFYAVLDQDDGNHKRASEIWGRLLESSDTLLVNNYVLVETCALLQRRLGLSAVRAFQESVVPLLVIDWVTKDVHQSAMEAVLIAGRKKLSLVDCVSFQTIRSRNVQAAFYFDDHFREQGIELV